MGFILGLQELDAGPADTLGEYTLSTCSELCLSCLSLILCGDSLANVPPESHSDF
jgi:hypothetical protein